MTFLSLFSLALSNSHSSSLLLSSFLSFLQMTRKEVRGSKRRIRERERKEDTQWRERRKERDKGDSMILS